MHNYVCVCMCVNNWLGSKERETLSVPFFFIIFYQFLTFIEERELKLKKFMPKKVKFNFVL